MPNKPGKSRSIFLTKRNGGAERPAVNEGRRLTEAFGNDFFRAEQLASPDKPAL